MINSAAAPRSFCHCKAVNTCFAAREMAKELTLLSLSLHGPSLGAGSCQQLGWLVSKARPRLHAHMHTTAAPPYMVSLAAAGAVSRASMNSVVPLGRRMRMNAPPPTPLAPGLSTPWQSAVATAASSAFPPALMAAKPATSHVFHFPCDATSYLTSHTFVSWKEPMIH